MRKTLTAIALVLGICGNELLAVDFTWDVDGVGDWSTGANWDPVGVPGLTDNILIQNTINPGNAVTVNVAVSITQEVNNVDIVSNGATPHALVVPNGSVLDVHGDITNNGLIRLDATGSATRLRADGSALTLSGNGTVSLISSASLAATGDFTITNGANHTIDGVGNVGNSQARVMNLGLIDANVTGEPLLLDPRVGGSGIVTFTNNLTAQASNGGTLTLTGAGGGEFGGTGTYQAMPGSEVVMTGGATVRSTTFDRIGDGMVRTEDGSNTNYHDITNNGKFYIGNNADARMHGTITNNGEFVLATVDAQSDLELGSNVTLMGGGQVTLVGALSRINSIADFVLTNVDNTIQGFGGVGNGTARIANESLIDANVSGETLLLDPRFGGSGVVTFENNATAQASNGGTLMLTGAGNGDFGGSGTYLAMPGSEVVMTNGATVRSTTFDNVGDGVVRTADGSNTNYHDIINSGVFRIGNNSDARMHGTVTNSDEIILATTGNQSDFELGTDVMLSGGGQVTLVGAQSRINSIGDLRLTNVDNTIQGFGNIGNGTARITNESLIDANVPGETMLLDPRFGGAGVVTFENNATARASNGGTLLLTGAGNGDFGGTGTYLAMPGSEVVMTDGATVRSTTFDNVGDGVVRTADGSNTDYYDITNDGQFHIGNNADARMHGTVTNNDEIILATTGSQSDFELGTNVMLTGGGQVTMVDALSRINAINDLTFTNVDNTIQGVGNIGNGTARVVNHGVIDASTNGQPLIIDPRFGGSGVATLINELGGVVRARQGGVLSLSGSGNGDFLNHNGGRFVIESQMELVNAAVFRNEVGGRVEGDGTITVTNGTFTNGGVVAPGLSTGILNFNGTYDQNMIGTMEIEIGGPAPGSGHDQLAINGTANLDGGLDLMPVAGQMDPAAPGTVEEFVVLVATDISGVFSQATYGGNALTPIGGLNPFVSYAGMSDTGFDGMFRGIEYSDTDVTFYNYLAIPGDANGDRTVDGQDFIIWNQNKFTGGTDWLTGDFNGDGLTNGQDFIIWNQFKFTSVDAVSLPSAVPEPSASLTLFLVAMMGLGYRGSAGASPSRS